MQDPLRFVLAAGIGTLLLVSLVVLRIYLVSASASRKKKERERIYYVSVTKFSKFMLQDLL